MVFVIDINGNSVFAQYEAINQGSINANNITLLAPYSEGNVISLRFVLPNGVPVGPFKMSNAEKTINSLQDSDGNAYNVWTYTLNQPVTQLSGIVQVQFFVAHGNGVFVATYTSAFNVSPGIVISDPVIPNDEELYNNLLNELASISNSYNNVAVSFRSIESKLNPAIENGLESIVYSTPDGNVLPGSLSVNSASYEGDFTIGGTVSHIDDSGIFYRATSEEGQFTLNLTNSIKLGVVQIFLTEFPVNENQTVDPITLTLTARGTNTITRDITITPSTNSSSFVVRYDFGGADTVAVSVSLPPMIAVRGIQLFAESDKYFYTFKQGSGNLSVITVYNPQGAVDAYNDIVSLAGKVGGYPVLIDIDGQPKLPSVYINQVDIKEYIPITSEEELDTINAQVGDVALLTQTVNDELTVTKSWILLSIDSTTRNWAVFGTSFATNAGNAEFATNAGNALTINGLKINGVIGFNDYNNLTDKSGIYFVSITSQE